MDSHSSSPADPAKSRPELLPKNPDLLCFSHLRWHFVTQRPQHLLSRAARTRRVFFWEEPIWHPAKDLITASQRVAGARLEIMEEAPNLWVIRPHITEGLDSEQTQRALLSGFAEDFDVNGSVRWYYTPMAVGFTEHLDSMAVVYDCMDELSGFRGASPLLAEREQQLFAIADVVFTGGIGLYEAKKLQHANVHAFPSSIEVEHFAQATTSLPEPPDLLAIAHPRIGFFGVVDERFDVHLLAGVAALRPHLQFVILGPVVKIDPADLPTAPNIHYLGSKTYAELPAYLAGWDAAILPFALNESTRFISPTKTPEYLAAGKPVVSTPIRDVVRGYGDSGLVQIARTAEEFASALDTALLPQPDKWREKVRRKLAESSWDSTWAAMDAEISTVIEERSSPKEARTASHKASAGASSLRIEKIAAKFTPLASWQRRTETFDYLVVGAGFAGTVIAERLASQLDKRVLVIDKRDHIAGNAYDFKNADGILIHQYGPHIFHTNADKVVDYLSRFTAWRPYEHRVLSSVDGKLLPVPINLDTINGLYGLNLDAAGMKAFLDARIVVPETIRTSEDVVLSRVGPELYEKFFRNYTRKQWGLDPTQLDAAVAGRIPVRFDRDDRYFTDTFQAMPLEGYTRMFERMLDHPRITIRTGVDYRDAAAAYPNAKIVYTGPIDEYFGFRFGPLPYRSLQFKHETHAREVFQAAPVVNYPNDHAYTRITEFKYLTGQRHAKTSIVYEFPKAEGDPYYPIPRPENAALYARYRQLAEASPNVHFCGRLANYRYLNMDQVVAQALVTFRQIADIESRHHLPVESASPRLGEAPMGLVAAASARLSTG